MGTSEAADAGGAVETASVARVACDEWTVTSAPPASSEERCCACNTTSTAGPGTVRSNAFNASKASELTVGTAIIGSRQHAAGSSIHVGISTLRTLRSSSKPHRHKDCPHLMSTSYTATVRPTMGATDNRRSATRYYVCWVVDFYHRERNHQGLKNALIERAPASGTGRVHRQTPRWTAQLLQTRSMISGRRFGR